VVRRDEYRGRRPAKDEKPAKPLRSDEDQERWEASNALAGWLAAQLCRDLQALAAGDDKAAGNVELADDYARTWIQPAAIEVDRIAGVLDGSGDHWAQWAAPRGIGRREIDSALHQASQRWPGARQGVMR
jgi:hypothetical protein